MFTTHQISQYYRSRVPELRQTGRQWRGPCPVHQGVNDSFAVEAETGRWMCHSKCGRGGGMVDLEAELGGYDTARAFHEIRLLLHLNSDRIVVAEYSYTDEHGQELFQVVRYEPKAFAQRHRGPNGDWIWNRGSHRPVLYRLHQLAAAPRTQRVWIVEGEKDVHTLENWGLLATTNAGGAGKWPVPNGILEGRPVTLVPDADPPGRKHACQVAAYLKGICSDVRIVDLPYGKDVSEFAARGGTREQLEALEPVESNRSNLPPATGWPEPLAPEAFHGLAGEITRSLDPHTEADPAAILIQLLVAFGSLMGRNAHFLAEADRHYGNLFAVLIGETAKGRKGTSWGHIASLLGGVDPGWATENITGGCGSGEGLIWAVRDEPEKGALTPPDKRMLILEPEFARVLQVSERESNTLSAVLRQAWDSGNLRVMTRNNPAKASGAHISLIGHITADELRRHLSNTAAANGFANRFLWVCARRSKLLPFGGQWRPQPDVIERLRAAAEWARSRDSIVRDGEANEIWGAVYEELSAGAEGLFGAVTSRAEAQTMRLATLYAVLDRSARISADHLRAALAVWRYTENSARYVFGESSGDRVTERLLELLRAAPHGLTRTEIRDAFQRRRTAEISAALARLREQGQAVSGTQPSRTLGAEVWRAA